MPDRKSTILIVEDDPAIQELLAETLRDAGYEALGAAEGGEAVDLARQRRPDLVVLDLAIPGLSGHSVLHELRESPDTRHIPVVIASGYEGLLPEEDQPLVQGVLQKPYDLDEFLETVASALRREPTVEITAPVQPPNEAV